MIPRRIFQTWKRFGDWPVAPWPAIPIGEQVESWRQQNPTFEYCFFSDDDCFDFVHTEFPELERLYHKIAVVKRADLWRYMVLYRYGGIYGDLDCLCVRSLLPLLGDGVEFVAGVENDLGHCRYPNGSYTNWCIASAPGHPVVGDMIETLVALLRQQGSTKDLDFQAWRWNVLETTGPICWTEVVRKYRERQGVVLGPLTWFARGGAIVEEIISQKLPAEVQEAYWRKRLKEIQETEPDTYVLHTYLGTWKNDDRDKE